RRRPAGVGGGVGAAPGIEAGRPRRRAGVPPDPRRAAQPPAVRRARRRRPAGRPRRQHPAVADAGGAVPVGGRRAPAPPVHRDPAGGGRAGPTRRLRAPRRRPAVREPPRRYRARLADRAELGRDAASRRRPRLVAPGPGAGAEAMSDAGGERSRFAHRLQNRPSITAEAVTMARALEHLKPEDQRVVDDPYAHLFLSRASRAALAAWSGSLTGRTLRRLGQSGTTYVPLRHRFIDDHLSAA